MEPPVIMLAYQQGLDNSVAVAIVETAHRVRLPHTEVPRFLADAFVGRHARMHRVLRSSLWRAPSADRRRDGSDGEHGLWCRRHP